MQIESLTMPSVYVKLIMGLCENRGLDINKVARRFNQKLLDDPYGRVKLMDIAALVYEASLQDEAIGYEIGLNTQVTSHGLVGYGLLTNATIKDALGFGIRYGAVRAPFMILKDVSDGDLGIIEIQEAFDLGANLRPCREFYLIGVWRIAQMLLEGAVEGEVELELHFQHAEPACHKHYEAQLPPCHFSSTANQIRFPREYMDLKLATADEMAALIAAKECEREQALTGEIPVLLMSRVNAVLAKRVVPPSLGETADLLHMSARSLKRKLKQEQTSYQQLLDNHRQQQAVERLRNTKLGIADIAEELGYTAPENFTRAFRKWTGMSPSQMRSLLIGNGPDN